MMLTIEANRITFGTSSSFSFGYGRLKLVSRSPMTVNKVINSVSQQLTLLSQGDITISSDVKIFGESFTSQGTAGGEGGKVEIISDANVAINAKVFSIGGMGGNGSSGTASSKNGGTGGRGGNGGEVNVSAGSNVNLGSYGAVASAGGGGGGGGGAASMFWGGYSPSSKVGASGGSAATGNVANLESKLGSLPISGGTGNSSVEGFELLSSLESGTRCKSKSARNPGNGGTGGNGGDGGYVILNAVNSISLQGAVASLGGSGGGGGRAGGGSQGIACCGKDGSNGADGGSGGKGGSAGNGGNVKLNSFGHSTKYPVEMGSSALVVSVGGNGGSGSDSRNGQKGGAEGGFSSCDGDPGDGGNGGNGGGKGNGGNGSVIVVYHGINIKNNNRITSTGGTKGAGGGSAGSGGGAGQNECKDDPRTDGSGGKSGDELVAAADGAGEYIQFLDDDGDSVQYDGYNPETGDACVVEHARGTYDASTGLGNFFHGCLLPSSKTKAKDIPFPGLGLPDANVLSGAAGAGWKSPYSEQFSKSCSEAYAGCACAKNNATEANALFAALAGYTQPYPPYCKRENLTSAWYEQQLSAKPRNPKQGEEALLTALPRRQAASCSQDPTYYCLCSDACVYKVNVVDETTGVSWPKQMLNTNSSGWIAFKLPFNEPHKYKVVVNYRGFENTTWVRPQCEPAWQCEIAGDCIPDKTNKSANKQCQLCNYTSGEDVTVGGVKIASNSAWSVRLNASCDDGLGCSGGDKCNAAGGCLGNTTDCSMGSGCWASTKNASVPLSQTNLVCDSGSNPTLCAEIKLTQRSPDAKFAWGSPTKDFTVLSKAACRMSAECFAGDLEAEVTLYYLSWGGVEAINVSAVSMTQGKSGSEVLPLYSWTTGLGQQFTLPKGQSFEGNRFTVPVDKLGRGIKRKLLFNAEPMANGEAEIRIALGASTLRAKVNVTGFAPGATCIAVNFRDTVFNIYETLPQTITTYRGPNKASDEVCVVFSGCSKEGVANFGWQGCPGALSEYCKCYEPDLGKKEIFADMKSVVLYFKYRAEKAGCAASVTDFISAWCAQGRGWQESVANLTVDAKYDSTPPSISTVTKPGDVSLAFENVPIEGAVSDDLSGIKGVYVKIVNASNLDQTAPSWSAWALAQAGHVGDWVPAELDCVSATSCSFYHLWETGTTCDVPIGENCRYRVLVSVNDSVDNANDVSQPANYKEFTVPSINTMSSGPYFKAGLVSAPSKVFQGSSAQAQFKVENLGGANGSITPSAGVTLRDGRHVTPSISPSSSGDVQPGGSMTFTVTFSPGDDAALGKLVMEFIAPNSVFSDMIVRPRWWDTNYGYRREITSSDAQSGDSVKLTLDSASLVSGGRMLANGNDARVVFNDGHANTELDRMNNSAFNSPSTELFFNARWQPGAQNSYWLYYGYPQAVAPPSYFMNVFKFGDDFNDNSFDESSTGYWSIVHFTKNDENLITIGADVKEEGGKLVLNPDVLSAIAYSKIGFNTPVVAKARVKQSTTGDKTVLMLYDQLSMEKHADEIGANNMPAPQDLINNGAIVSFEEDGKIHARTVVGETAGELSLNADYSADAEYLVELAHDASGRFAVNVYGPEGSLIATATSLQSVPASTKLGLALMNYKNSGSASFDDVRVYNYPAPAASLKPEVETKP
jgi:hypothetical protein